jgi:hypothetical protein
VYKERSAAILALSLERRVGLEEVLHMPECSLNGPGLVILPVWSTSEPASSVLHPGSCATFSLSVTVCEGESVCIKRVLRRVTVTVVWSQFRKRTMRRAGMRGRTSSCAAVTPCTEWYWSFIPIAVRGARRV